MTQERSVHQILTPEGQAACQAVSAPDWFALDCSEPAGGEGVSWGPVFSPPRSGNKVQFFTTGAAYYRDVLAAIEAATSSVFITGWQVNFDVELMPGRTLLAALTQALKNGANVYVLPWQNVPGAVDTAALTTSLAIPLLNGVPGIKGRAWCMTAPVQADQGMGNMLYSHHQKSVVIDNRIAYCGGIDLAYGRRDDERFSLKADGRHLNELYNACVPLIHEPSREELQHCVTPLELLAAIGSRGKARSIFTFLTSPSQGKLAWVLDRAEETGTYVRENAESVRDWWSNVTILGDLINFLQDGAVDAVQGRVRASSSELKNRLAAMASVGSANAANAASAITALLSGQSLQNLPLGLQREVARLASSLFWCVAVVTNASGWKPPEHYARLFGRARALPLYGSLLDAQRQPRMPWQDVQCRIEGPSVFDLSRNFVDRWNAVAHQLEAESVHYRRAVGSTVSAVPGGGEATGSLARLLGVLGIELPTTTALPRIAGSMSLAAPGAPVGQCTVQVMRSASRALLQMEAKSKRQRVVAAPRPQNNCLKAMLKAISSARHFIYIEGQFFQSAHGASGRVQSGLSGPMASMLLLKENAQTRQFLDLLEIRGAKPSEIPSRIRWAKIDDVMRMAGGPEFLRDLDTVLKNIATREALTRPTAPQAQLLNPIGKALVDRIARVGLKDGLPFHVYIVLPVHPEGTLDTLNIMSQVHLTMHSLVFGEHSLVNGVRRAILTDRIRREKRVSWAQAQATVNAMNIVDIVDQARHDWKRFVTLLNLRNWDHIGGQPVTEQVYVHSKLLIADDQVAVLGSANINDRSMLGDRDSELAAVITSRNSVQVPLAGPMQSVAAEVHELRVELWRKHFGAGLPPERRASSLLSDAILKRPGVPATWEAIRERAERNSENYGRAFWYLPRSEARAEIQPKEPQDEEPGGAPASIWPTWKYQTYLDHGQGGRLLYRMPFDPLFWREPQHREAMNSWTPAPDATRDKAPVAAPREIQGFIVTLPTEWTRNEDNLFSKSHIATIAVVEPPKPDTEVARNQRPQQASTV